MYIERFLEKKILKYMGKKEIIAIVGARQCGKTTLMKHIFNGLRNAKFISFDDRDMLELFVQDIKSFVDLHVKGTDYLFIDEFQYAKDGGKQLKYIYDSYNTKILISGSSSPDMSVQNIKYLVGRIFVFNLYPLSFGEYLNHKDKKLFKIYSNKFSDPIVGMVKTYYNEFVTYGGYPRVVLSDDKEEKTEVIKNIYNTYFLKEIKEILQLTSDFKLSRLIKILALQTGGVINYNELSSATGFSYPELLVHLNILQKTFVCIESRPFFTNKKKELVKAPKMFFIDSGFRNIVLKNFQNIPDRTDYGAINENFIASELTKQDISLRYWRTKAKAEVDFVVEMDGKLIPMEVKSNQPRQKISRSFMNFLSEYEPETGFILSSSYFRKRTCGKTSVYFYPIYIDITKISNDSYLNK